MLSTTSTPRPPAAAQMLRLLGSVERERGEYKRSLAYLEDAAATPSADPLATTHVLMLSGFTAWLAGGLDQAGRWLDEALRRYISAGSTDNAATVQIQLAAVALYRGQYDRACELAGDALTFFSKLDVREEIAWALNILGLVELRQGNLPGAIGTLRASLDIHVALGDRWRQASVLEGLAEVLLARDEVSEAAELLDRAAVLRVTIGAAVPAIERPDWERTRATIRKRLSEMEPGSGRRDDLHRDHAHEQQQVR